jgi:hypothetical protein
MKPTNAPHEKNIPELLQEASGERDPAKVAVLVIEIVKRLGEGRISEQTRDRARQQISLQPG